MPVYKTEAIVIRRTNLGEADRLVTLYARDHGKVAAVAKGARKPKSRFAGRLELFTHLRALMAVGKSLDVVSQIEVLEPFTAVRGDLSRLGYASFIAEVTDRATADREPAPEIFRALRAALTLVAGGDAEMAGLWFAARILGLIGYAPVVGRCAVCGRLIAGSAAYSYALGGTLCEADRQRDPQAPTVSAATLKSVAFLQEAGAEKLPRLSLDGRLRTDVTGVLHRSLEYRLETRLKSPLVIQKLRQQDNAATGHRGKAPIG